jgi:ornithine cyclodeaminase
MGLRVIDQETVRRLLTYEACIPLMREAMIALSAGQTRQTLRQIIDLDNGRMFGIMPGGGPRNFGAKLISVFPENFAKGVQSHQGAVLLFDPETGAPTALIHAGELTAIRTAAATAAATDSLARPDASRLTILGYGEQAREHAHALAKVRPLSEIRLWGRSAERAAGLARRLEAELGREVTVAATAREAVRDADLICAVTAASEPILEGAWVADGAHVNLVGSSRDGPREADDDLVARARVFADHREGVLRQGAEVRHAIAAGLIGEDHVLGEIGEVMAGERPGRTGPSDVTLYKSLGAIVQDLFAGEFVHRRAMAENAGTHAVF